MAVRRVEYIMGTAISIEIVDPLPEDESNRLADVAFAWFHEVDQRFSTYKQDSEVNRFARGELTFAQCSPDMRHVLDVCASLWSATSGYFDTWATGRLDPSGYVKGWSVQVASDRLMAAGAVNHFINAGGDVRVRGESAPGDPWRIGIQHPWEPMKVAWVLAGDDLAIATSGTYERGTHVIDPFTGEGAAALCSVTVVGPDLAIADAYATAAVAMGEAGVRWLGTLDGYQSAVITQDGRGFESARLPNAPALRPDADPPVRVDDQPGHGASAGGVTRLEIVAD